MIIPRQSIIYCHPQEFCVSAGGDKVIVKAYFKFTDLFLLVVKCIYFVLLKFKDNSFAFSHLFKVLKTMLMFFRNLLGLSGQLGYWYHQQKLQVLKFYL